MRELPEQPTAIIANYQVYDVLGVGPLGKVYRAKRCGTDELVVFRGFHRPKDADPAKWELAVGKYQAELAKHAAIPPHPNVQRLVAWGSLDTFCYLASEYFEGTNLYQILGTDGKRPLTWALPVFRQIAAAIDHAHNAGMVHGSLALFNALVLADGSVKVINFGLAHARDRVVSAFTAPEQLSGALGDRQVDVYGMAVQLYTMLAGHAPFEDQTPEGLAAKIALEPPPALPLPAYVNAVLAKAMAKDPAQRYASCAGLIDDLVAEHAPAAVAAPAAAQPEGTDEAPEGTVPEISDWDLRNADWLAFQQELEARNKRIRRKEFVVRLCLAAVMLLCVRHALRLPAEALKATVGQVKGTCWLFDERGRPVSALTAGVPLHPAQTIRTGDNGEVLVTMWGSTLKLRPNSELTIRRLEYANGRVRSFGLRYGDLWAKVDKIHRGGGRFVVWAGPTKVNVTGTHFGVNVGANGAAITTLDGKVTVGAPSGPQLVTAGQQWRTPLGESESDRAITLPASALSQLRQVANVPSPDSWVVQAANQLDNLGELLVVAPYDEIMTALDKDPIGATLGRTQAIAKMKVAVLGLVTALNMGEEGVPATLDLSTLAESGLTVPEREKILVHFRNHQLDSYKRLGPHEVEIEVTSADESATRMRYKGGKMKTLGSAGDD